MMRGTMDDKTTVDLPSLSVVQQAGPSRDAGDDKKSRVSRKHVIVGVTCAVVIAMVITGVLVGVKFFLDSTNDIVKHTYEFKRANDQTVTEDVITGVKDNYVQYHLEDEDTEIWVINDFNRDLQVIKMKIAAESMCYVATLNHTYNALPEALLNATSPDDVVETDSKYYEMSETPIKDNSLLGTHGQTLCANLDVHWMTPTCDADSEEPSSTSEASRQKRGWFRRLWCSFWKCVYCYKRYCYSCRPPTQPARWATCCGYTWGRCCWKSRC